MRQRTAFIEKVDDLYDLEVNIGWQTFAVKVWQTVNILGFLSPVVSLAAAHLCHMAGKQSQTCERTGGSVSQ